MTENKISNTPDTEVSTVAKKLSIQASLNGLSFSILNRETLTIEASKRMALPEGTKSHNIEEELKGFFHAFDLGREPYAEVVMIHSSPRFSLVPKALFDPRELAHYLKLNSRINRQDDIEYDQMLHTDLVNVYVPFTGVNSYIRDIFPSVEVLHSGSILIQSILQLPGWEENPQAYVNVGDRSFELIVLRGKDLLLYNYFEYTTQEDFLYYLLFASGATRIGYGTHGGSTDGRYCRRRSPLRPCVINTSSNCRYSFLKTLFNSTPRPRKIISTTRY